MGYEINQLIAADKKRDEAWLHDALQLAIQLEFFTIPPYLAAFWSVKDQRDPVAVAIREVLVEEMLHMSLVCNMLKSIGGTPRIAHNDVVPSYPNSMPGGVNPDLQVHLEGLNEYSIQVFMEIEKPEEDISLLELVEEPDETYPRIGAFYDEIQRVFFDIQPTISRAGQLEGYFGESRDHEGKDISKNIGNLEEVKSAIALIKDQGEGTAQSVSDEDTGELAHYYRFKEIYVGRKIVWVPERGENGEWVHIGEEVTMPDCWNVGKVPKGGYKKKNVPKPTWELMSEFDQIYTQVLFKLDSAWSEGNQGQLHSAMEMMMDRMPALAREIMQVEGQSHNFSPSFKFRGK